MVAESVFERDICGQACHELVNALHLELEAESGEI
jgi:hypothetical protein